MPLLKTGKERNVLGIVLEPETVDAEDDIYSAAEIRDAAHRFMEQYQNGELTGPSMGGSGRFPEPAAGSAGART